MLKKDFFLKYVNKLVKFFVLKILIWYTFFTGYFFNLIVYIIKNDLRLNIKDKIF